VIWFDVAQLRRKTAIFITSTRREMRQLDNFCGDFAVVVVVVIAPKERAADSVCND
jgi:hypothetical protein